MNSPKKNFIYNIIYQLLILVIPLVTAPYLARTLGAKGVGTYSYTYSIVNYFMILTLLGVNNYGNRSIAKARDDKNELSKTFLSIYMIQLFFGLIMIILYLCFILLLSKRYLIISLIEIMFIISAMLDINWFFFGIEEFKKTIIRNTFVKFGNAILIFIFVKSKNDVWKYTLIMSSMTCLSQIMMWGFLRKNIKFVKVKFENVKKHIKPNLILFIPVIAISLYKIMDKIMLGAISNVTEVGFYENAEKIISIPSALITALGTVMLPRMSNLTAKGDFNKIKDYIKKSEKFVMFMSLSMCFGLIAIAYHFAPLFFGKEFQKTGILIIILSITLPFISFANVLRTQYLIPQEKDSIYVKSVFFGALTNLFMNIFLIYRYGSVGACIATIFAELFVMLYQSVAISKELPIKCYFIDSIPFLVKSLIMFICIFPFNFMAINSFLRLLLQVLFGIFIYCFLNYKYILSIVNLKKFKSEK